MVGLVIFNIEMLGATVLDAITVRFTNVM